MKETLSILSGIIWLAGYVPYIRAILKKEAQPVKASWIIWTILSIITLTGMFLEKAVNGLSVAVTIGDLSVLGLTIKYGIPGWTRLDKFCFAGATLGLALWFTFENPVLGIVTSQVIVVIGSIPTFASIWKDPSRENKLAWTLFWASCICAVLGIKRWAFADASQSVTFLTTETFIMYLLYIRPSFSRASRNSRDLTEEGGELR
ncbi:MAG: hypothetical protein WAP55_00200 [Minisyncoccia bacterium]